MILKVYYFTKYINQIYFPFDSIQFNFIQFNSIQFNKAKFNFELYSSQNLKAELVHCEDYLSFGPPAF